MEYGSLSRPCNSRTQVRGSSAAAGADWKRDAVKYIEERVSLLYKDLYDVSKAVAGEELQNYFKVQSKKDLEEEIKILEDTLEVVEKIAEDLEAAGKIRVVIEDARLIQWLPMAPYSSYEIVVDLTHTESLPKWETDFLIYQAKSKGYLILFKSIRTHQDAVSGAEGGKANEQWKTENYVLVAHISEKIKILSELVRKTTELHDYISDFVEEVEVEKLENDFNLRIEDLPQRLHLALSQETKKLKYELRGGMKTLQSQETKMLQHGLKDVVNKEVKQLRLGLKDAFKKEIKQLKLDFHGEIKKLRKNMEIRPTELLDYNQSLDKTIKFLRKALEVIEEIATKPWVNAKVRIPDFQVLNVLPTAPCKGYALIADKRGFESLPFGEQIVFFTSTTSRGYKLLLENLDLSCDEGGSKVLRDPTSSSTNTNETPKVGNVSDKADKE